MSVWFVYLIGWLFFCCVFSYLYHVERKLGIVRVIERERAIESEWERYRERLIESDTERE